MSIYKMLGCLSQVLLFSNLGVLVGCNNHQENKNFMYVDTYVSSTTDAEEIVMQFDDKIVFKGRNNSNHFWEKSQGPFVFSSKKIKVRFSVGEKDTSFILPLKKKTFCSVGYSSTKHQFQFYLMDSVKFYRSRID